MLIGRLRKIQNLEEQRSIEFFDREMNAYCEETGRRIKLLNL